MPHLWGSASLKTACASAFQYSTFHPIHASGIYSKQTLCGIRRDTVPFLLLYHVCGQPVGLPPVEANAKGNALVRIRPLQHVPYVLQMRQQLPFPQR